MNRRIGVLFLATLVLNACDEEKNVCSESVCQGDVLVYCRQVEVVEVRCPFGCADGACMKLGQVCENGAVRCSEAGVPQMCTNNVWQDQTACVGEMTCRQGVCVQVETTTEDRVCDEGGKRCSRDGVPQICRDNRWEFQSACVGDAVCIDGECERKTCGNDSCTSEETCVNDVCVPTAQLAMADGASCDPSTWVEYCSDANEAVSCASLKGVYRTQCSETRPCKVGDFTAFNDDTPWFPAFCDSPLSSHCYETTLEIPYCTSVESDSGVKFYEATYICAPTYDGFMALDYAEFGYLTTCEKNGCDDTQTICSDSAVCDSDDDCEGDVLKYCSNGQFVEMDCEEYEAVCRATTLDNGARVANCFLEDDVCTTVGETKTSCTNGVQTTRTCVHSEVDGKNYWMKSSAIRCATQCKKSGVECAK